MTATQEQLAALAALGEAIDGYEEWLSVSCDEYEGKKQARLDIDRLTAIKEGTTDAD